MVRYDPKSAEFGEKQNKTETSLEKETGSLAKNVTKEKFYMVSDTIKAALKEKSTGFSLLETYGEAHDLKDDRTQDNEILIHKKNPMVVDSSDEEEEEIVQPIWAPKVFVPMGPRDNFFFSKNDPLIAGEFTIF